MALLAGYLLRGFFSCALIETEEIFFEIVWEFRRKIRQRESERAVADFAALQLFICTLKIR